MRVFIQMKRPLWLLKVAKSLWFVKNLPEKFPILGRIAKTLRKFPLPFYILDFSPMKHDLVFT